jgi:hypothetical protein
LTIQTGWDVTTHLPQHQSYHIFITIITLANNKTKKEKQNREANESSAEKKKLNATEQKSRRRRRRKRQKKEQDHTLISFHGDCAFLALKKKKTNRLARQSCSNSSDGNKLFLIFNPMLVNPG